MSTDDRIDAAITTALGEVAADTTDVSDEQMWAAITAASTPPSADGRWRRPVLLAAASVAAIALVVGVAVARGDGTDGDSELDVVDDPTTTVEDPDPDPTTTSSTTSTSVPEDSQPDDVFVGPGSRPMVVVSANGDLVTAYFSDGRDPIRYEPTFPVSHAELGPDGTFWLTTATSCPGCTPHENTRLVNLDPSTGQEAISINGAGYAAVSPIGTHLAYVDYQANPDAVIITQLGPLQAGEPDHSGHPDNRNLPSHDPDGPTEDFLWALGQIQWSPDGTRLLVNEFWEDDIVWLVDLGADDYIGDGTALNLGGTDWITDDRLLGTQYCCYGDGAGEEPRHLVEVDLSGDEPVFIDRDELSAGMVGVAPGGLDAAVHVVGDEFEAGPLVRIATGDTIAEDVVSVQW